MDKIVEQLAVETLLERPRAFTIDVVNGKKTKKEYFYIYPLSLGRVFLTQRILEMLELNSESIVANATLEILRIVKSKRDECLTLIVFLTCKDKEEIFDYQFVEERKTLFAKSLKDDDIASLLMIILTDNKLEQLIKHYGIDKESDDLRTVMRIKEKSGKNTLSFGGKSLYGSLIHPLLEMGLSWDEIMWQRSYMNLRLLLLDKVTSVYLTDEEMQKIPARIRAKDDDVILPTKENMETIMKMGWK